MVGHDERERHPQHRASSDLNLPNGCVPPKTTPTVATTLSAPGTPSIGQLLGRLGHGDRSPGRSRPGRFGQLFRLPNATAPSDCTSGGSPVGTVGSPSSSSGNTSTYNLGTTLHPDTRRHMVLLHVVHGDER